jgi:hypothetical protein
MAIVVWPFMPLHHCSRNGMEREEDILVMFPDGRSGHCGYRERIVLYGNDYGRGGSSDEHHCRIILRKNVCRRCIVTFFVAVVPASQL